MSAIWEVVPEVKTLPSLNKPLLIEGLPGIGCVGKITADFLIEECKAIKLYSFFSHKFPHSVFVNEQNLVDSPKIELYYKKFPPQSKKRDLLILAGDIQPIDEEGCYTFCEEVIKIAKRFDCPHIVALGGIGLHSAPQHPKVYCTSNTSSLLKEYTSKSLGVEKTIYGAVGPIIGVSGVLLGLGVRRGINTVALLAETNVDPLYMGVTGARELIRLINLKYKYNLNLAKLTKDVIELEKENLNRTQEWTAEMHSNSMPGTQGREDDSRYIG